METVFTDTHIETFAAEWWSQRDQMIGVVLVIDHKLKEWRAYIGIAPDNLKEREREQVVATRGVKLSANYAAPFARVFRKEEKEYRYAI